jgi:hypothetical protein
MMPARAGSMQERAISIFNHQCDSITIENHESPSQKFALWAL